MIDATRTPTRTAVALVLIALLLILPAPLARAEESSEAPPPPGVCLIAWVRILGIPVGFASWQCLALKECNALVWAGPVDDTNPVPLRIGASVPNPFSPGVSCLLG